MKMENKFKGICSKLRRKSNPISSIIFLLFVCCISVSLVSNLTGAPKKVKESQAVPNQENNNPQTRPQPEQSPAPQPAQSSASAINPITQAAVQAGVLSSIKRVDQVVTFLTANNQSGAYIFPVQNPPDQHIFSTSLELIAPNNSILYATASFFPNQDAVYDTVEYVNMGCEEVEKTVFNNLKRIGVLKNNIIMLDGGAVKVFLMPAGSGCIVIKKEIVQ